MEQRILDNIKSLEKVTNQSLETSKKILNRINGLKQFFGLIPSEGTFQINVTEAELEILIQSLGARKKLLRGKIRNNEGHLLRMDKESWSEKDFQKAIQRRKIQLADTDMLKTRIENI